MMVGGGFVGGSFWECARIPIIPLLRDICLNNICFNKLIKTLGINDNLKVSFNLEL